MTARPYSPDTLAARWGCSAEKVRLMYRDGEIAGFRLGKLIRIPADEIIDQADMYHMWILPCEMPLPFSLYDRRHEQVPA